MMVVVATSELDRMGGRHFRVTRNDRALEREGWANV